MRIGLVAAVLLGGCNLYFDSGHTGSQPTQGGGGGGGGHPGGGGAGSWADAPPASPEAMFDASVYPVLQAECASCHVGGSVGFASVMGGQDDPVVMYAAITGNLLLNGCFDSTQAILIQKGNARGPGADPRPAAPRSPPGSTAKRRRGRHQGIQIGCIFDGQILAEEEFASCETVSGNDITTTGALALFEPLDQPGHVR